MSKMKSGYAGRIDPARDNMSSPRGLGDGMWAGMTGPALFVSIFVIEGRLRAGYDSRAMYISALSLGPRGWIQILNFVIFGVLLLAFARGLAAGTLSRVGPALLAVIAIGNLLLGLLVMDAAGNQMSFHGKVHRILARMVLFLMPVSCFVFVHRFRQEPKWGFLEWCTLAAGTTTAIAVAILAVATTVVSAKNAFAPLLGLFQRAAVVPYMGWLFIFALTFRKNTAASVLQRLDHPATVTNETLK
jgi:hypothetical protein